MKKSRLLELAGVNNSRALLEEKNKFAPNVIKAIQIIHAAAGKIFPGFMGNPEEEIADFFNTNDMGVVRDEIIQHFDTKYVSQWENDSGIEYEDEDEAEDAAMDALYKFEDIVDRTLTPLKNK